MSTSSAVQGMGPAHAADELPVTWGVLRKIGFRLMFCYILLFGLDALRLVCLIIVYHLTGKFSASPFDRFWGVVVPWVAHYLFYLPRGFQYVAADSGDSVSDYLQIVASLLIAAIVAAIWSFLDSKRPNYRRLNQWIRLYAQFVLAATMFSYGFDKVIPLQFGELTPSRLSTQIGDLNTFSMLWVFMAASKPYTIFSGVLEVLSGVLLLVPKLRTLGAILAIVVMTNVFVLNLFYDVSVKSFSFELLLLAIFLAWPEFPRLIKLLVLNQTVDPRWEIPLSHKRSVVRGAYLVQGAIGACVFLLEILGARGIYARDAASTAAAPLYGIWKVDEFQVLDNSQAPLFTEKLSTELHLRPGEDRWNELIFDSNERAVIELGNRVRDWVNVAFNKDKAHVDFTDSDDPKWRAQLAIQQQGKKSLHLQGRVNGVRIEAKLHLDDKVFRLSNDEYHIIQK